MEHHIINRTQYYRFQFFSRMFHLQVSVLKRVQVFKNFKESNDFKQKFLPIFLDRKQLIVNQNKLAI
jgi:hypothetical protein